jgi:hypothetical protein
LGIVTLSLLSAEARAIVAGVTPVAVGVQVVCVEPGLVVVVVVEVVVVGVVEVVVVIAVDVVVGVVVVDVVVVDVVVVVVSLPPAAAIVTKVLSSETPVKPPTLDLARKWYTDDGFKLFRVTEWLPVASDGCEAINP